MADKRLLKLDSGLRKEIPNTDRVVANNVYLDSNGEIKLLGNTTWTGILSFAVNSKTYKVRVFTTAPILSDLSSGELVIYDAGSGTRRIYANINGTLYYADLA